MKAIIPQRPDHWAGIRASGKSRFVAITALAWFVVVGLVPLPYLLEHAIVPQIVPVVLCIAIVSALLVGAVAWHFFECGYLERTCGARPKQMERMRGTVSRFMLAPFVLLVLLELGPDIEPGPVGIAVGSVVLFAGLLVALIGFERAVRRAA